jgi:hypothetical protein
MSIRRYSNPDQFTLKYRDLQTVPEGQSRDFDFNGIKVHKGLSLCCDDTKEMPCAYDATPTDITGVTAVTFKDADGVNVEKTFVASTDAQDLLAKLASALISDGVDPYYNGDDYRGITIKDGVVRFVSTVEVVNIKTGATVHTATKKCNKVAEKYSIFEFDVDGGFTLNATELGPYATGASATIVTAVTNALTGAGYILTAPVVVTETSGKYLVQVYSDKTFTINGSTAVYKFIRQTWAA